VRRQLPAALLLTSTLLVTAACTSGGDPSDGPIPAPAANAGGAAGSEKNPHAQGPLTAPADAAEGGTITVLSPSALTNQSVSGWAAEQLGHLVGGCPVARI
jgi:hypothetical protein